MATIWVRLAVLLWGISLVALGLARLADVPRGDAARGASLYNNNLYCAACHLGGEKFAPAMQGVSGRALHLASSLDQTAEQYLAESILDPDAYLVAHYRASVMPVYHFCPMDCRGLSVTLRDVQDLVAYLKTLECRCKRLHYKVDWDA